MTLKKFLIEVNEPSQERAADELSVYAARIISALRPDDPDADWECVKENYKDRKGTTRGRMILVRRERL